MGPQGNGAKNLYHTDKVIIGDSKKLKTDDSGMEKVLQNLERLEIAMKDMNGHLGSLDKEMKAHIQILPKEIADDLNLYIFGVHGELKVKKLSEQDGAEYVEVIEEGSTCVAFFVKPRLAITTHHGILGCETNKNVRLNRSDGAAQLQTKVVAFDATKDYALLLLAPNEPDQRFFTILKNATNANLSSGHCTLLGLNIFLYQRGEVEKRGITTSVVSIRSVDKDSITYGAATFSGDSGGAIVVRSTGEV